MMGTLLTIDLGPGIVGWRAEISGSTVCVASPQVIHDSAARREMRDLIARQGGDCGGCRGCPIGQKSI